MTGYRKLAFQTYPPICALCGFGIPEILEVAHLDGDRRNSAIENLAILCANCHKMHDIGIVPGDVIVEMRDRERAIDWNLRLKDAPSRAAQTRKRRAAGRKAWDTRQGKKRLEKQPDEIP